MLISLLDALEWTRRRVLGFSMGGYIAQELALHHPNRVNRLILLSTAPSIDGYGRAILDALMRVRKSNISREGFLRVLAPLVQPEVPGAGRRPPRARRTASLADPIPARTTPICGQALLRLSARSAWARTRRRPSWSTA
ncbi:MAG: alpha/beta fold hydrolase [Dehalococcoidia bacterium]|nr:alpha/beta fold hydrolase [Dehalococcoidia bacterium]